MYWRIKKYAVTESSFKCIIFMLRLKQENQKRFLLSKIKRPNGKRKAECKKKKSKYSIIPIQKIILKLIVCEFLLCYESVKSKTMMETKSGKFETVAMKNRKLQIPWASLNLYDLINCISWLYTPWSLSFKHKLQIF